MKSLKKMTFKEVEQLYWNIFNSLINEISFKNIAKNYKNKCDEFIFWVVDKKLEIKGVPFGRESKSYGLNILYGWFLENIFLYILKKNKNIKSVSLFGNDYEQKMKLKEDKIEISGKRTTLQDFKIQLTNGASLLMELKSAAKGKFTIKKGNVSALMESTIRYEIPTVLLMLDLNNKKYELKDFNYFTNKEAKPNNSMEGQLCYDFPIPTNEINEIINVPFDDYAKNEKYKKCEEYKKIKKQIDFEKTANRIGIKLVKNKLKLEDLEKKKFFLDEKIAKLRKENPNIDLSWDSIDDQTNKN